MSTSFYAEGEAGPAGAYYRYGGFAELGIQPNETLLRHVACRAHRFLADFDGSTASVGSFPTANWALKVLKNGLQVGEVSFSPAGDVSLSTTGGFQVNVQIGDVISVQAPTIADPEVGAIAFTFSGEIID